MGIQPKLLTMLVVRLTSYACLPKVVNLTTNKVSSLGNGSVFLVILSEKRETKPRRGKQA